MERYGDGEEMVYTKVFFSQSRDITTDPESQRYAESLFPQSWLSSLGPRKEIGKRREVTDGFREDMWAQCL